MRRRCDGARATDGHGCGQTQGAQQRDTAAHRESDYVTPAIVRRWSRRPAESFAVNRRGAYLILRLNLISTERQLLFFAHAPLAGAPILFYVLVTLLDTHLTTACVTLYLHRSQTHGAVTFHPAVAHVMRAWLCCAPRCPPKSGSRSTDATMRT